MTPEVVPSRPASAFRERFCFDGRCERNSPILGFSTVPVQPYARATVRSGFSNIWLSRIWLFLAWTTSPLAGRSPSIACEPMLFSRAAVTSTNGALATFAGGAVPVGVWRVEPDIPGVLDGSRVRVTATLTNGSNKTSLFIADTNAPSGTIRWTVRAPGDLFDHLTESWTEEGATNAPVFRFERMAWRWPGGTTNVFVQTRKLAPFSWGW